MASDYCRMNKCMNEKTNILIITETPIAPTNDRDQLKKNVSKKIGNFAS